MDGTTHYGMNGQDTMDSSSEEDSSLEDRKKKLLKFPKKPDSWVDEGNNSSRDG